MGVSTNSFTSSFETPLPACPKNAAGILGVDDGTAARLMTQGDIPSFELGAASCPRARELVCETQSDRRFRLGEYVYAEE